MSERSPMTTPSRPISIEHKKEALRRVNRSPARWLWDWMKSFVIAVFLFLLIRAFGVEAFKIPSGSMERTLLVGDFLLVNKLIYGAEVPFVHKRLPAVRAPRRGDVIVFTYPLDPSLNYVKRLVGEPGDTLSMRDGVLFVNDVPQHEPYVTRIDPNGDMSADDMKWQREFLVRTAEAAHMADHPSRNNWGPLIVPGKSYFVLGDNRDNSADSRWWGFVADTLVRGRPLFVYYSYTPDASRGMAWLTQIRWRRIGERIR
jgi:signal peptidase I